MSTADTTSYQDSELGKPTLYDEHYNPDRLYPMSRDPKRKEIGIDPERVPFFGFDCWNHYEVSWLNPKGKPMIATAEIVYDCRSPRIVESKSLKLYFNSFNQATFASLSEVEKIMERDLSKAIGVSVRVTISLLGSGKTVILRDGFDGICIDDLDVTCSAYSVEPSYLSAEGAVVAETLYSDILKSNCLVTNQPDWGSVQIAYRGQQIDRAGLLQYFVSFRKHNEFHEQCIERIFMDILRQCAPEQLAVYGRYTRRGGLDINPYRSTQMSDFSGKNQRLARQ